MANPEKVVIGVIHQLKYVPVTLVDYSVPVFHNLEGRQAPWSTRDSSAGMGAGAALVIVANGRAVSGPARNGTQEK
jgi:hypothetical protein